LIPGKALKQGLISEDRICSALVTSRGDLFLTASYLDVSPRELDSFLRTNEHLQAFAATIEVVKSNAEYDKMSAQQFEDRIDLLNRTYRIDAVNAIHELATMSYDSAAMAEVKLKAAIALRGKGDDGPKGGNQSELLTELNQLYHQSAQRIRTIRVAQIEYEQD